jgi:predicted AlkP superfamily pyrophosphatase or phosphodiesterase
MRLLFTAALSVCTLLSISQVPRPKLVVGIVVDQMRWDYLYRYYERYAEDGGFRRMLDEGFSCENTLIPYTPTVTGCGHASLYTGTVPAINGITGNYWFDRQEQRSVYCTEDKSVATVGSPSAAGRQSPANLLVTTICDEMRLATNFRSKVIGVALKDRGGIVTAGHSANAAYWYDGSNGNWISSTYYMNDLPAWAKQFNALKRVDALYGLGWSLLFPAGTYVQSTADDKPYESKPFGNVFPYDTKKFIGKDYGKITAMPAGNTLTFEFSRAAIEGEGLGLDEHTDFLAVSFSSPDYIGHSFGPNSVESEDGFLRFDRELGEFFEYLDKKIGRENYTAFLSADHGVAHVPEFMLENKLPGGRVSLGAMVNAMNDSLELRFGAKKLILSDDNYQVHFDHRRIESAKLDLEEISAWVVAYLSSQPGIARAFSLEELNEVPLPARVREMLNNGYYPNRNGDVQFILQPNHMEAYSTSGTTHGLWNPYDAHIPLLWYGWGIKKGSTNRPVQMTDVAPTLAALLKIQEPSGSIGTVISEALK